MWWSKLWADVRSLATAEPLRCHVLAPSYSYQRIPKRCQSTRQIERLELVNRCRPVLVLNDEHPETVAIPAEVNDRASADALDHVLALIPSHVFELCRIGLFVQQRQRIVGNRPGCSFHAICSERPKIASLSGERHPESGFMVGCR